MTGMTGDQRSCDLRCSVRRAIPKINGSSGAFIAIIVILIIIIIAACTASIYLLRKQDVFDLEARPFRIAQLVPRYRRASSPSTPRSPLTALFGRIGSITTGKTSKNGGNQAQNRRGKQGGWLQTTSVDDLELHAGIGVSDIKLSHLRSKTEPSYIVTPPSPIILSAPGSMSIAHDPHRIRGSKMKLSLSIPSQVSLPSISESPSSSQLHSSPSRPGLSNPMRVQFDNDSREYVGPSGRIMRTLQGGTKFMENL